MLIDFFKGFDLTDTQIWLEKLKVDTTALSNNLLYWFTSYLSNSKQTVKVNKFQRPTCQIRGFTRLYTKPFPLPTVHK